MCVKLSMLQERDYGDPALLQVRPYYPFRVHRFPITEPYFFHVQVVILFATG